MKARTVALLRSMMVLSLEVYLLTGGLLVCGFIPLTVFSLTGFALQGIILTSLGCWLYQGGSGSFIYHLLLYPLVALVLFFSYQSFGLIAALIVTGLYYWRVQFTVSNHSTSDDYSKRFTAVFILYAGALVYFAIIHQDVQPLLWLMTMFLVWYLLIRWGEYMTREQAEIPAYSPAAIRQFLFQTASAQILLIAGYLLSAGTILLVLSALWQWLKQPLGQALSVITEPIFALIAEWVSKLSALLAKNKKVQVIADSQFGPQQQKATDELVQQGTPLIERLEPYLIVISLVVFAVWLGYIMWKRRHRQTDHGQKLAGQPHRQTVSSLKPTGASGPSFKEQLRSLYQRFQSPKEDTVRYQYFQFLRHMASLGMVIDKSETPSEFLERIRTLWNDPAKTALAGQITGYYERHRYAESDLSQEEMKQLVDHLEQLRRM